MFGTLGGQEILLILILALIVFGPRKLPEIGKSMGKMLAEFRKASNDFKRTIEDEVEAEKIRASLEPTRSEEPPSPPAVGPSDSAVGAPGPAAAPASGDAAERPPETTPTTAVPEASVSREIAPAPAEPVEHK